MWEEEVEVGVGAKVGVLVGEIHRGPWDPLRGHAANPGPSDIVVALVVGPCG